jgi:hypothetical protein
MDWKMIEVKLKKRSLFGRIILLPKMIETFWKFSANCKFLERVTFCLDSIKIIFR